MEPIARGPRLFLRLLQESDRRQLVALKLASRAFLERWEATPPEGGADPWSDAWFDRIARTADTEESRRLIICGNDDSAIMGQIGIGAISRGAFHNCFLGYWIGRGFARQGYMSEALTLTLKHIFDDFCLHRVEANIIPANRASKALVATLGFRCEGTAKRYLRINHAWRDHERWAMTAEDWQKLGAKLQRRFLEPEAPPRRSRRRKS